MRTDPTKRATLKKVCTDQKWVSTGEFSDALARELGVDRGVLGDLYPNNAAPSDHPPVSVELDISFNIHPGVTSKIKSKIHRQTNRLRGMLRSK